MYPGYHASNDSPICVAPTCPRSSSRFAIAMPIMFTSRDIRKGASLPIGSENGGSQMRVGNGDD
jgi:hypothetical protein